MVGVKSFRNVGQKRFVGTDRLLRFASVCICFGKAVAGRNRGGMPAAKSPNLIGEKRLIHGNASREFLVSVSGRCSSGSLAGSFAPGPADSLPPSSFASGAAVLSRVGWGQFVGGGAQELIVEAPRLLTDCLADFRRG